MGRRVFKFDDFDEDAGDEGVTEADLLEALRIADGGGGNTLGGSVLKVRVAREGGGKSSGYRVLLAHHTKHGNVFFMYIFPKNEQENIPDDELDDWKDTAKRYRKLTDEQLAPLVADGSLIEIVIPT